VHGAALATVSALAWGWFEAGWVRLRGLPCPVRGLPPELAGLRIAHLSDLHLGVPSRGAVAAERAVAWVAARQPDLVCVTGDLLTRPAGAARARELLARLPGAIVVLGNHDVGVAKDPLVERSDHVELGDVALLRDESVVVELRGRRVQLVGLDPRPVLRKRAPRPRPEVFADEDADLRILLSHFPKVFGWLPAGAFHVTLSGHVHDGQINIPYGRGKIRLGEPHARYPSGLFHTEAGTLHVSPGLGTTLVPFRFFARPEATELLLEPD
jgi:uncharacterized protein